jgi:hypothetical protein
MLNRGTRQKTGKKVQRSKLPGHARLRLKLPVMFGNRPISCVHSLSMHAEVMDEKLKLITISYALPCLEDGSHKEHRDTTGRAWK